jgi:methionyl-tRNA formyltransferase
MGTPSFAVPILERLAEVHDVVAVYTRPDAASGRGRTLLPPPVKVVARRLGIPVRQPASLRTEQAALEIAGDEPAVIVVAAYGLILPPSVLSIPEHGCVNVHASLLPRHRGAAPVHRAILEGDPVAGVSIMLMEEGLDTGPYALQRSLDVDELDADTLTERLAQIGAEALIDVLERIENGTAVWTPQSEALATYAAKVTKDDVALEPTLSANVAARRVRASSHQAASRIVVDGVDLAVIHVIPSAENVPVGIARRVRGGLLLGLADGVLLVDRLRPAGKAEIDGAAWANGSRLSTDTTWRRA